MAFRKRFFMGAVLQLLINVKADLIKAEGDLQMLMLLLMAEIEPLLLLVK
nr:hypothetical protein [Brachyspira hyodysenteriae]